MTETDNDDELDGMTETMTMIDDLKEITRITKNRFFSMLSS